MDGETRKPEKNPEVLLRLSEQFLRRRYFDDCRKYARQAHQLDPNFPGVSSILAVADVLLTSKHEGSTGTLRDWYDVLQLDRYSQNSDLIKKRFDRLYELLKPMNNNLPFADEAFDIVCEAWYVLSSSVKKSEFDDSLRKFLDDDDDNDEQAKANCDFAFWTVCPYCYYLYEFPRVYLELCLMCPNEKCSKAFTCVEIDRPPIEVLTAGKYMCFGFLPVGFQRGEWNPFAPVSKQKANPGDDTDEFVQISDDEDETDKFVQIPDDEEDEEEDGEVETKRGECVNLSEEEVNEGAGGLKMEADLPLPINKLDVRRKKSVAKNTKKVTGIGNRVRKQGFVHPETTDNCVFF